MYTSKTVVTFYCYCHKNHQSPQSVFRLCWTLWYVRSGGVLMFI